MSNGVDVIWFSPETAMEFSDTQYRGDKPGWKAIADANINLSKWCKDHCVGKFDCEYKFNSGNPHFYLYFAEQRDAEFFWLAFSG